MNKRLQKFVVSDDEIITVFQQRDLDLNVNHVSL